MKTPLTIAALTIFATVFYAYVSHLVPQTITYPPESVELSLDMSTGEMVRVGQEIVGGKGTCLSCHTIGASEAGRFPDLGGIGAAAATRQEGMTGVEYLAQSLYEPDAFIVEGFNPGMIAASKPPVSLTDQEILAVIAYLQSLGGTPTVTMQTQLEYAGQAAAAAATPDIPSTAPTELTDYACVTCHSLDQPLQMVGPSLYDVGKRLSVAELYESIMDPDATLTEGFAPGLMIATLNGVQFYDKVTASELKTMVAYLASRKGNE